MIDAVLPYVLVACTVALLLSFVRLLRGPSLPDRVLALDTMYVDALVLLLAGGLAFRTRLFFEAALIIAMLGFVSTVAIARYLGDGRLVE